MSDKLTQLLPCPFCGCTKVPKRQGNGIGDYWLECFDCGASTRLREDGAGMEKDWNRRPSPAPAISESEDAAPRFDSPLTPFGQLVRSLRVVTGTLLGDMARAMGVSSAELSAMELGRRPIAPEHVGAASEYFQSCGLPRTAPLLIRAVDAERSKNGGPHE